jgi:hypothetical protein
MGRALAVVVALMAIAGAIYFGAHKLSNPDNYQSLPSKGGPGCVYPGPVRITHPIQYHCSLPSRAVWQIPLASLLAAVALGAVLAAGADVRPRRRPLPRLMVV